MRGRFGGRRGALSRLAAVATVVVLGSPLVVRAGALRLAAAGESFAEIVVASGATPAERTAAEELATYLERASGAHFPIRVASVEAPTGSRAEIHVGATFAVRQSDGNVDRLAPEAWSMRREGQRLLLYGGRPRGTLYAVYRFLEDELGVRWWTPWDEHVPRLLRIDVGALDRAGEPAFDYRDIWGIEGGRAFCARSRLNGDATRLGPEFGGRIAYGPPHHVHTFYDYVPPDEWFDDHPEFFSEIGGLRLGANAQLCLTQPALFDHVVQRMNAWIEEDRRAAAAEGREPARLFSFSPNDWRKPCECDVCVEAVGRRGGRSGLLLEFVDRLADRIAESHPEVLVDTLAYEATLTPPADFEARPNVVVRFAALTPRDFSKPLTHPANAAVARDLEGWSQRVRHLRVWDYATAFPRIGDLPLPDTLRVADDYRYYRGLGVDGIYVEHRRPQAENLGDLRVWMQAKLMEDPRREAKELLAEFTDGYYGEAGRAVRRYVRLLDRAGLAQRSAVRYGDGPASYAYLDADLLLRAQAAFDRGARRITGQAERLRRLAAARLALDRATLARWPEVCGPTGPRICRTVDPLVVAGRYRRAWSEVIDRSFPAEQRAEPLLEVEREIDHWLARIAG